MSKFRDACLKALKESEYVTIQLGELTNGQESYFFLVGGRGFFTQVDDCTVIYYDKEGGQTDYTYSFDDMCKMWISLKNKGFKEVNR